MSVDRTDGRRSLGTLLRDLAEGGSALVRQEVRLAKVEFTSLARSIGKGTALTVSGGVLAFFGGLTLLAGLILLAGDQWLRDNYWLSALIITVITGGVALWFARRGITLLSPARLAPDETVATLKEDKEWVKRQLTSDGTSR
jgi:hypothetical protein